MATRTLIIDLSKGTGGEPMYGIVTVQRARATSKGTFEVLPWETKLKLHNGVATITEAVTDGSGPFYDSAYLIRVQNGYCAPRWGFMTALPDGTTPISTGDMPKVNPITGEGIYMDAQEWNALYGTLPDRVTSLENSQSVQDGKIATLQTGKANTVHTHVIGDVTGLQPALNAKGNATMRVDTTVGTRVFITDGTTERMISGDTGWRSLDGVGGIPVLVRRYGDTVEMQVESSIDPNAGAVFTLVSLSDGYRPRGTKRLVYGEASGLPPTKLLIARSNGAIDLYGKAAGGVFTSVSWSTTNAWPTTLPGTPA